MRAAAFFLAFVFVFASSARAQAIDGAEISVPGLNAAVAADGSWSLSAVERSLSVAISLEDFSGETVQGTEFDVVASEFDDEQFWFPLENGIEHMILRYTPHEGELLARLVVAGADVHVNAADQASFHAPDGSVIYYRDLHVLDAGWRELESWFQLGADGALEIYAVTADADWPIMIDPIAQTAQSLTLGNHRGMLAADFNLDGIEDLLVGDISFTGPEAAEGRVKIFLGTTSGLNAVQDNEIDSDVAGALCGAAIAFGDVTGDGIKDVVVLCLGDERVRVYAGSGGGGYSSTATVLRGGSGTNAIQNTDQMVLADLNGSAPLEVVISTGNGKLHAWSVANGGDLPDATLDVEHSITVGQTTTIWAARIAAMRFDNNAQEDILVSQHDRATVFRGSAAAFLSAGQFTDVTVNGDETPEAQNHILVAGDFDRNGFDDIVVSTEVGGVASGRYFLNDADGGTLIEQIPLPKHRAHLAADFNFDDYDDIYICDSASCVIWAGQPTGIDSSLNKLVVAIGSTLPFTAGDYSKDGARDFTRHVDGTTTFEVFDGEKRKLITANYTRPEGEAANQFLGRATQIGDVDGDGFGDVVTVGRDNVRIYRGGYPMPINPVADWSVGIQVDSNASIALARFRGTTNPLSLVIGEPEVDSVNGADVGRIRIFDAPIGGGLPSQTPVATVTATVAGMRFGASVANCRDLMNSLGDCLVVGAPDQKFGSANGGTVWVFKSLGSSGLDVAQGLGSAAFGVSGTQVGCTKTFGSSVAGVGNVDGINRGDLLIGAPECGTNDEGRAFLITSSSATNTAAISTWVFEANEDAAHAGAVVAALGDTNGDGRPDMGVSAPEATTHDQGRVWIFHGRSNQVPATNPNATFTGTSSNGRFGTSLAGDVDINRDGIADITVGTPNFSNSGSTPLEGRADVYLGRSPVITQTIEHTIEGQCANCFMGISSAMGFVNPDAYGDLAWGAIGYSEAGQTNEGEVVVRIPEW